MNGRSISAVVQESRPCDGRLTDARGPARAPAPCRPGEIPDTLPHLNRLDEAARHLTLEQLALSPQCGFASVMAGNELTEDEQWRKLDRMIEVATRVWGAPGSA